MRAPKELTAGDKAALEATALRIRESVIRMATEGGCFLGASLSAVDLVLYLYREFLHIPSFDDPGRDYFFLSKGHDVPALYATLAELGLLEKARLQNHLKTNDSIYWHPNTSVPGVEFHSGSLGHLLSVGIGVALDLKMRRLPNRVVVLLGDGELDEGSNWEALLVAQAYKLSNLLLIVDRNHFQANVRTEELIPLEPLEDKFRAFGAATWRGNGHDFQTIAQTLRRFPFSSSGPSVFIADTVRGKGLPSIEARADRWFCNFSAQEIQGLLGELKGQKRAKIQSMGTTVR